MLNSGKISTHSSLSLPWEDEHILLGINATILSENLPASVNGKTSLCLSSL
jgi:hypothetical protein